MRLTTLTLALTLAGSLSGAAFAQGAPGGPNLPSDAGGPKSSGDAMKGNGNGGSGAGAGGAMRQGGASGGSAGGAASGSAGGASGGAGGSMGTGGGAGSGAR